jgi:hypothetical protein
LAPSLDKGSDDEDGSFVAGDAEVSTSSPLSGPVTFPSTQLSLVVGHHDDDRSEDEEVISISGKNSIHLRVLKLTH